MWLFLLNIIPDAMALDPLYTFAQGTYRCVSTQKEQKILRRAAIKKSIEGGSLLVRTFAPKAFKEQPHICQEYRFETKENQMHVVCDTRPAIDIMLDGSPTIYKGEKGTISSVAQINGSEVIQEFSGKNGRLTVTYEFFEHKLKVIKTIENSKLPAPFVLVLWYEQQP